MKRLSVGVVVCLLALLCSVPSWAQGTASLTGVVSDPTGAVVPGAQAKLSNPATGVTLTTTSGGDGVYAFLRLAPTTYRLEVTAQGFKTAIRDRVVVAVGITTTLNVQLEVGAVAETVEVEAATAAINTSDASMGNPLLGAEVSRLPALDRNPAGLLSLQPGVAFVATGSTSGYGGGSFDDGRSGSVSGSRSDQTNITLDGVDVNDPQYGIAFTSVLRATQDSLQEFRVTTANYNADLGRSSGGQVQLITKSGSNELHGSAYYTHRNEFLNANDFFLNQAGQEEGKFRRHIYGASLGGPVVKNRFFVFGTFERLQESLFGSARRDVPSMGMRNGVFMYRCVDRAGFANCPDVPTPFVIGLDGNQYGVGPFGSCRIGTSGCGPIPAGVYALSQAELQALDPLGIGANPNVATHNQGFPAPNVPVAAGGVFDPFNIVGFRFAAPIDNEYMTYILRADVNLDAAAKHTLYWRGTLQDDVTNSTPQFPGQPPSTKELNASKGFAMGYKAVISPTTVNEFRWGITRLKEGTAGLQGQEYVDFRFISNLQDYESDSLGRTLPQYHFRDDFTLIRGKHTIGVGTDLRFTRNQSFDNGSSFQYFLTNASWTPFGGAELQPGSVRCMQGGTTPGTPCTSVPAVATLSAYRDGMISFMGVISQATAFYNFDRTGATLPDGSFVRRKFAVDEYEFYVQDQWRLTPALTFTYGLRYFVSSPPYETNGNQVVPFPNIHDWFENRRILMLNGLPTSQAGLFTFQLAGPANNGPHYYPFDYNNFSPRVALAWAPRNLGWFSGDGKLVIRGGYSLVYDRVGNGLATSFDAGGSFGMASNLTNNLGSCNPATCPRFVNVFNTSFRDGPDGIRGTADDFLPPSPGGGFPATPPTAIDVSTTLDSSIEHPYAHMINFSLQREFAGNLVVEAAYVGRRGRKLLLAQDKAMQADLCDPASGVCWFEAARQLVAYAAVNTGLPDGGLSALGPIAYWENLFPSFGPGGINGGCLQWQVFGTGCGFSATQVAYDYMMGYHGVFGDPGFGASTVMQDVDFFGFPGYMNCSSGSDIDGDLLPDCPFAMYPSQYVQLNAYTSIARSEYHALQLMLRKRMSQGVLFTINYTWSHSLDHSSNPERADVVSPFFAGGYSGATINAWAIDKEYSHSDFDMRHQLNGYYVVELPFGRGRRFGAEVPGVVNQILGGWEFSGIVRINSGLPAGIINARTWPTNWNLQGNATCAPVGAYVLGLAYGACPPTQNVKSTVSGGGPNLFADPAAALQQFRFTEPGERGLRNGVRADSYFSMDFALSKSFPIRENHKLQFRWEVFNLTNSTYFDAVSLFARIDVPSQFGSYSGVMGGPRRMQLSLRYEF